MAVAAELNSKRVSFIKDFDAEFQNQLHEYVEKSREKNDPPSICEKGASDEERRKYLESALSWLKDELREMKSQDRSLAKQLIGLRTKIQDIMQGNDDYIYASNTLLANPVDEDTKF